MEPSEGPAGVGFFREGVSARSGMSRKGTCIGQNRIEGNFNNTRSKGNRKVVEVDNSKRNIKVYYCNSRSIRNKIDLLRGLASVERPEVIAITETWLDTVGRDFKTEFEIEGYKVFHRDRIGRTGGGTAIYVKDSLNSYSSRAVISDVNNETLWVEVVNGREKLLLGCIYRPPSLTRNESTLIFQEINVAATRYKNVCIMGDFNYRSIDWVNNVGDNESEDFINVVNDNFLKQLVNVPTRENNILDLILTNREDLVNELEVGGRLGNSDHEEIRFNIKWGSCLNNENQTLVPDFRRGNYEAMIRYLSEVCYLGNREGTGQVARVPWESSGEIRASQVGSGEEGVGAGGRGVDGDYNKFINLLSKGQELHIPHRKLRSCKNDPKWMTGRLRGMIGIKRGIYRRLKAGEVGLRDRYTLLARNIKKDIRRAKRDYEIRIASNAKII